MYKNKIYVFIDFHNLIQCVGSLGWKIDFNRLFQYFKNKYQASKIFVFAGYLKGHDEFYRKMHLIGYKIVFKEVFYRDGEIKANVDVDLAVTVMLHIDSFDKAVIVSGDGDFKILIDLLKEKGKFRVVIAPSVKHCSSLIKRSTRGGLVFIDEIKDRICAINEKGP